jgi:hypothetical protein
MPIVSRRLRAGEVSTPARSPIDAEGQLPPPFGELELFIEWALPTEQERYLKRMDSSMDQLQVFYDAVAPRAEEAREYLDKFDLADMPPEAQRLMWLLFSLMVVSFAVEVFKQPLVPDTGSAYMERLLEPPTFPV